MRVLCYITARLLLWAIILMAGVAVFSCANENIIKGVSSSEIIAFNASINNKTSSRSISRDTIVRRDVTVRRIKGCDSLYLHTIVSNRENESEISRAEPIDDISNYGSFGVFAYVYKGSWNEAKSSLQSPYMDNAEVKESGGYWCPIAEYRWPLAEKNIRFFAYAPYNALGINLPEKDVTETPVIKYNVPSDVAKQKDILASCSEELTGGSNHEPASLTFKHVLTAIKFVSGDEMLPGKITRISLNGIYSTGNYTFETDKWDVGEEKGDFNYTFTKIMDGAPDVEITPEAATFMMIPQVLPEGAEIEVEFADRLSNVKQTLSVSITGSEWPAGKTIEYRISTQSIVITPHFKVTPPNDFSYTGGTSTYYVDSRVDISTADEEPLKDIPVKWAAQFSTDDGVTWTDTKPEWLTTFSTNGNGNNVSTPEEFEISVTAQKGIISNMHNEKLRGTTALTSVYDLSTKGGTTSINTANCYIVNAPGNYTLPLVYGNAIKNGENNISAYTSQSTGSDTNVLKTFVNHRDVAITSPYIYLNEGCIPADACLVWQDVPDLIQNVKLSGNKHNINFKVSSENIMQGNALIAVRDNNGTIMWSWHIWITDYILGSELDNITNYQGKQFSLLHYPIGWCDPEEVNYSSREVKVKFTQEETGKNQIVTIKQISDQLINCSNQSYFQWGRKDPMLGGNIITGTNQMVSKQCYTEFSEYQYTPTAQNSTIGNAIQHPYAQYCTGENWSKSNYRNLWSADNNQINVNPKIPVKTIYDPSPVGFCVPPSQTFTGFTKNGLTTTNTNLMNVNGTYNWGWNFYCSQTSEENSPSTYFAATGYRALSDGTIKALGVRGYAWTAGPISTVYSWSLFYTDSAVYPAYNDFEKSYSFPVRPCKEN